MNAIGQPISRLEGRLKTTGAARYTADLPIADVVHGVIVQSTIANGRTVSIDTGAAEKAPGVLAVFTHRNLPRMNPTPKPWSHLHPHGQSYLPLQDDQILYADQPVALVVATTRDQAAYAGTLIGIQYESSPPAVFDRRAAKDAVQPPQFLWPVASSVGNAEEAIADSPVKIEQTYTTADRHHNQMEPHAATAVWDADGALTLYETTQHIFGTRELVSMVLGIPPEKINVVCQFLGGGFGGKAYVWPHTLIAAAAAKVLNRPVHVQLTRAQMYSMTGHQCASMQVIRLGADRNGKLNGIRHGSITPTSMFDNYIEYAALCPRSLWAATGGIATNHKIAHVNRNTPTPLRAPHEALGHFALESALDELAYAIGVDPVTVRLLNDTEIDPESGRPFSTRAMRKCLIEGAARFGWEKRTYKPRDKAKVESGVQLAERWIIAALRNRKFFSIEELNQAIRELRERINQRPFRKREGSRATQFAAVDKPAMVPLPSERFDLSEWSRARVNIDCHIAFDTNYYSVPYNLVRELVEVRSTPTTIEIFHKSQRVASHLRAHGHGHAVTIAEHRPRSHQAHLEWTPSRMVRWAQTIGPNTARLFERILADKPHPEMGYRGCLGIIRLAERYSAQRVEAASERALITGACRYKSVESILRNSLDQVLPSSAPPTATPPHDNIRGAEYFE